MSERLREFSFWEHIEELRSRLLRIFLATIACGSVGFFYSSEIMAVLLQPFNKSFINHEVVGLAPSEAFTLRLWLGIYFGLIVGSPYILWQVWKFLEPGLYSKEKRAIKGVFVFAVMLFVAGVSFGYFVLFPYAMNFFSEQYKNLGISPQIRVSEYLSLLFKLLLGAGVVFLFPCVTYLLTKLEILKPQWLVKQARYAIVTIFIVAAVLTPPDVITQILLAGPMILLYFAGFLTAKVAAKSD